MKENILLTLLHDCYFGNVDRVKEVIEKNEVKINSSDDSNELITKTIIGRGLLQEKEAIIKYLSDQGADINYLNGFVVTSLISNQDLPLLKFVVDKLKANIHINDDVNMINAIGTSNKELVLYLLAHDVKLDENTLIENKDIVGEVNEEMLQLLGIEHYN